MHPPNGSASALAALIPTVQPLVALDARPGDGRKLPLPGRISRARSDGQVLRDARFHAGASPRNQLEPLHRDLLAGILADAEPIRLLVKSTQRFVYFRELATRPLRKNRVHLLVVAFRAAVRHMEWELGDIPRGIGNAAVVVFVVSAQDPLNPLTLLMEACFDETPLFLVQCHGTIPI